MCARETWCSSSSIKVEGGRINGKEVEIGCCASNCYIYPQHTRKSSTGEDIIHINILFILNFGKYTSLKNYRNLTCALRACNSSLGINWVSIVGFAIKWGWKDYFVVLIWNLWNYRDTRKCNQPEKGLQS